MDVGKVKWETEKEWTQYGLDNGYDERNVTSLQKSDDIDERRWYSKGSRTKSEDERSWKSKFPFDKQRIDGRWQDEGEWVQYGLDKGYGERNPSSLERSNSLDERRWYSKGIDRKAHV